ncbi:MAG TPA: molybdopterin-dependent oxidoreductase, partial [Anaerolineae bacterium]|nr:molybdopterin-dependent oxidoreductase [Anaerolineae bacterium]
MQADKVVRSTCPFCGVGCQVLLNVKDEHVFRIEAPFDAAPNYGRLCVKGRFGTDFVHNPKRLAVPLIRRTPQTPGHRTPAKDPDDWREATWDEALDLVVGRLLELRWQYGPDSLTCNVCAKATNEDNYMLQKYFRAVLGTNNVDHCTRLCHAGSVKALQLAISSSAMSNSIAEMKDLECFIITGSNTAENHPVIATFLKEAVTHNGAKLIVIDPRWTEMVNFATLWLRQKPGTDTAVFNAMAHVIVKEKLYNETFIADRTEGFSQDIESLEDKTPEWAEAISGVPAEDIRRAARMYAQAKAAAMYWGMGISQSVHGTDNALTLINLALMTGQIGRPGTGLNPLRGQNNVQGCSDSGGMPTVFTAYQPVTNPDIRHKFEQAWHTSLSGVPGLTTTEMVDGILTSQVRGWYVMGEDPLMSEPDLNHARHAVEQLEFYVAQDIFFNESNVYADVILPAAAFAEKDGTFTNSDRRIQRVRKAIAAPGLARADWEIVMDVAKRTITKICQETGQHSDSPSHALDRTICQNADQMLANWSYHHPGDIWDEMRQLTPDFYGATYERMDREGGVHWPCPALDHPVSPYLFEKDFPSGRGKFFAVDYKNESELPDE